MGWKRRRTRPAAERSPCGQAQGGGSRGRGPAGVCHSKARAARVGEGTFSRLWLEAGACDSPNSSDVTEITGRRQVRAPSLSLDRVSKPIQRSNGTLQNSTFQSLFPQSLTCPCRSLLFSPDPQISCFPLAGLSSTSFPSDPLSWLSCRRELCPALGPHCLPRVSVRPSCLP